MRLRISDHQLIKADQEKIRMTSKRLLEKISIVIVTEKCVLTCFSMACFLDFHMNSAIATNRATDIPATSTANTPPTLLRPNSFALLDAFDSSTFSEEKVTFGQSFNIMLME